MTKYQTVQANGINLFYREAGNATSPTVLLLHGFPTVWGQNDSFFLPAGAKAFTRDNPSAQMHFHDTGHFALETHAAEIATAVREFLRGVSF